MTLSEIKTKVPELQTKIADLVKLNEGSTKRLAEIDNKVKTINLLNNPHKASLQTWTDSIAQMEKEISSITDPTDKKTLEIALKQYKKNKADAERIIKSNEDQIKKLEDEKKDITKPDSEYSKRAAEVAKVKSELDEICDLLVQDPTINYHMQTAVMVKYDEEIDKENAKKEAYQKADKDIKEGLKDDSAGGLKSLLEEVKKGREEFYASLHDKSKDANSCRDVYEAAMKKLHDETKSKFSVDLTTDDIDAMASAMAAGKLDELSIPSLETAIKDTEAVVKKMEESRDKTLESIEAKKSDATVQPTKEMEENQENINKLKQEVTDLSTEISDIEKQIEELNKQIEEKEDALGEPSKDYVELKDAEKFLKDNHIITDEVVPDLADPDSDISKKYKKFEEADLAVRKAFQECKIAEQDKERTKSIEDLKKAIEGYQKISEELTNLTGFDTESWHNYLLSDLNDRVMDGEKLDSAYSHTDNANFKEILDDKEAMNNGKAIDEYEAVEDSLYKKIDPSQEKILKGDFSIEADKLFTDADKGYFKLMDNFQDASGFKDDKKGFIPGVTIYDLVRDSSFIERKPLKRISGFFKNIAAKFRPKKPFKVPEENENAIERYRDAKTDSVKKEIEDRKEVEALISKKEALVKAMEEKTTAKVGKEVELTQAEEKQAELAKSAPARSSKIEGAEIDFRKVKYDDSFVQAAVEKVEHDDDDGR